MAVTSSDAPGSGEQEPAPPAATSPEEPASAGARSRSLPLWLANLSSPTKAPPAASAERVNRIDQREMLIGAALSVLQVVAAIVSYVHWHDSHLAKDRAIAPEVLVADLIGAVLMIGGTLVRRRALLGFAALLVGLESLTFGSIFAVLFLFFGGWLIFRVQRQQQKTRLAARAAKTADATAKGRPRPTGPPVATKRYTPPRRAAGRSATARRR